MSKSPREIARETGVSHSSVRRIIKKDLNLKTFRLSTEDSGSRSLEKSASELLGTDWPGIDRPSNRPVAGQNFVGDSGQRRAY